ncbi:FtsX-like permease family protein [Sphingosinicella sp. BN140058]|uniref:FtsX-like permease family protein n=1 Tax=Sphingosinicella sp. BN140058 TaxID=1892855 RepID=UPI001010C3F5|nr:FtsX-like permease family protein [Sphingosinicella sp. BN140058]QAY76823.1 FtsX-like permease family protein [Sphingosinicella sp. BN140058]
MWRNHLVIALRVLTGSRTYAAINIFGLAIGLSACLMILLYVRYETTYDAWLPDAERVYQVQSIYTDAATGEVRRQQGSHGVIAGPLAKDFPQIEAITRADGETPVFLQNGEATFAPMVLADESFFRILQLPFLHGDRSTALRGMDSLVLSRSEAIRRFGTENPVGRTVTAVRRGEQYSLRVTGIFADIPRNSHLALDMVGRMSARDAAECSWSCVNGTVYLKLRPGADPEEIHRQMPAWEKRNIPPVPAGSGRVNEGDAYDWRLVKVGDVHLSGAEGEPERPGNDRATIATFAIVAAMILAMAVVNFVNLATARAGQRAREVALRKVLGARRGQLIAQFLAESLLVTSVALLIALALVELLLPSFSRFLGADLSLTYLGSDGIALPALGLLVLVGCAGGLYPAFHLSRYRPAAVIRANRSSAEPMGTGRLRNALVVIQFAVSIGLIVCTGIVYAQTRFLRESDPGYRRDGLIQIDNMQRAAVIGQTDTVIRRIAAVEGVRSVAGSDIIAASDTTLMRPITMPGRPKPVMLGWYSVHPDFFRTMGVDILVGRTLSRQFANDNGFVPFDTAEATLAGERALAGRGLNVVVNRLAARQMGFPDPQAALGKQVGADQGDPGVLPLTIVGVVEDSRFRSLRQPLEPMIFYDGGVYRSLVLRYEGRDGARVARDVAGVWKQLATDLPFAFDFADAASSELYRADDARGRAFGGFALLAASIACLGLFGLAAFTAERRTREIGIRKVFGARVPDIVRLLAWQFSKPVMLANLIAWPIAWWVMRDWLNGFDARVPLGPGPFLAAAAIALAVALGTVSGHAIRVARLNPVHALRYE